MNIQPLRKTTPSIVIQGAHHGIIQSILDYDHLLGRTAPSIQAVIAHGRKKERFFWGGSEVEVPFFASIDSMTPEQRSKVTALVNVQSARNVKSSVIQAVELLPNLQVAVVFAEGTPERHAIDLIDIASQKDILLVGPSSVGLLVPGVMKLGAIGGTMYDQLVDARIDTPGDVAIITTSGGMVSELIRVVTGRGRHVSFAVAMGGDRYPMTDPATAMLIAEADPATKEIVYFGELGGSDEYRVIELIKQGKLTKRIVAYIAGVVADLFDTPPQFGHAKALAQSEDESAEAKKKALAAAGVVVCDRFDKVAQALEPQALTAINSIDESILGRRKAYFMSHISGDVQGDIHLLGRDLLTTVQDNTIASLTLSMLLGEQVTSKPLVSFTDIVLRLLVDHSPNVSGGVTTMITARAGRDLVSGLAAGLLTIGPRFGGAVNGAADIWLDGVESSTTAKQAVEVHTRSKGVIPGIGHKKYRLDRPDPRVSALAKFIPEKNAKYYEFARSVEDVTTTKKANLILNVDGAIAAIMLDLLANELQYTPEKLRELVDIEFFNSLFIISRTIGFTAHYLDQRRNDEGLFRLAEQDLRYFN